MEIVTEDVSDSSSNSVSVENIEKIEAPV